MGPGHQQKPPATSSTNSREGEKGFQQLLWGFRKSISSKTKDSRKDPGATEEQDPRLLPINVLAAVRGLARSTHSVLVKGRARSLDAWDST